MIIYHRVSTDVVDAIVSCIDGNEEGDIRTIIEVFNKPDLIGTIMRGSDRFMLRRVCEISRVIRCCAVWISAIRMSKHRF